MDILDYQFKILKILLTSLNFGLKSNIKQIHNFDFCFVELLSNNVLQMVCSA